MTAEYAVVVVVVAAVVSAVCLWGPWMQLQQQCRLLARVACRLLLLSTATPLQRTPLTHCAAAAAASTP